MNKSHFSHPLMKRRACMVIAGLCVRTVISPDKHCVFTALSWLLRCTETGEWTVSRSLALHQPLLWYTLRQSFWNPIIHENPLTLIPFPSSLQSLDCLHAQPIWLYILIYEQHLLEKSGRVNPHPISRCLPQFRIPKLNEGSPPIELASLWGISEPLLTAVLSWR